jgi:hypothetical protein
MFLITPGHCERAALLGGFRQVRRRAGGAAVRDPGDPVAASAGRGSARSFLLSGLAEIWDAVGEAGELNLEQSTKIRLATTWAIDQAREVINPLYHSAGATAIFDNRPFEWRFRDLHTEGTGKRLTAPLRRLYTGSSAPDGIERARGLLDQPADRADPEQPIVLGASDAAPE